MATTTLTPVPQIVVDHVEREPHGLMGWLTTTDHKRIGILYMVTAFVFFIVGGVEALMMRLQLGSRTTPDLAADLQRAVHDARLDDDLPLRRADDGGSRQLLRAADDRRPRRRLPAPERDLLLAASWPAGSSSTPRSSGPRRGPAGSRRCRCRVDLLAGRRRGRVDLPDPPDRPRLAARRDQLLRDDRQHARAGHDLVAPAAVRLVDPDLRAAADRRDCR
jgi:hypothetical protein